MSERRYRAKLHLEPRKEGWARSEMDNEFEGLADAWLVASVIRENPDAPNGDPGGVSTQIVSMDGFTGRDLDWLETFKIWGILAHQLKSSCPPGSWHRRLASMAHQAIREQLVGPRE